MRRLDAGLRGIEAAAAVTGGMLVDQERFDRFARRLGAGGTRREAVRAVLGGICMAIGLSTGDPRASDARAGRRRRRRCDPACAAGQTCDTATRTCRCDNGGAVCGANCCLLGQRCDGGQCVALPNPDACIAFGEPCKNAGVPCCENLQCASGQGGGEIACWVRKTGRCTSTAECVYGTECKDGICVGPPQPQPAPTCVVDQCPNCPVLENGPGSILEKVCIDGACGCTCIAMYPVTGVNCRSTADCNGDGNCMDSVNFGACRNDSAHCCCSAL